MLLPLLIVLHEVFEGLPPSVVLMRPFAVPPPRRAQTAELGYPASSAGRIGGEVIRA